MDNKFQQIASFIAPESHVLDIGCGEGQLAPILTEKRCCVDGMDINIRRMTECRSHYKNLYEVNIESFAFDQHDRQYDVVVLSDVLEHLNAPDKVLEKSSLLLKEGGKILISLPNVAYFSNRLGLLFGRWDYQDEGILDRTHVRFFTFSTGREFVEAGGYLVSEMAPEMPVIASKWKRSIFSFACHRWPSLFAIGWVIEARPEKSHSLSSL
ncbi:MAG: hypothetical protein NPINA01_25610 [Nitrospinaceae bacterium]|nr:MAG: hypothetical protein NPINA01_25610 [Nitrospinaceae bacterium]